MEKYFRCQWWMLGAPCTSKTPEQSMAINNVASLGWALNPYHEADTVLLGSIKE